MKWIKGSSNKLQIQIGVVEQGLIEAELANLNNGICKLKLEFKEGR